MLSSGLFFKMEKEKPAWSSVFWKHLNYTAFTLCMAVNASKALYATQPDLLSIVFSILEHSHFITVQFGNDGFSLWRDAIDFLMYALEDVPDVAVIILESAFSHGMCLFFLVCFFGQQKVTKMM